MTRSCFRACKSIKNEECFDACFQKYMRTVGAVNRTVKKLAYEKHSLFGYKGYPEPSIESAFIYDTDVFKNLPGRAPMTSNRDYAA
jgi:hypothetical protein